MNSIVSEVSSELAADIRKAKLQREALLIEREINLTDALSSSDWHTPQPMERATLACGCRWDGKWIFECEGHE